MYVKAGFPYEVFGCIVDRTFPVIYVDTRREPNQVWVTEEETEIIEETFGEQHFYFHSHPYSRTKPSINISDFDKRSMDDGDYSWIVTIWRGRSWHLRHRIYRKTGDKVRLVQPFFS